MKSIELAALLRAHRGNAHTVANLYVLRQAALEEDDRDFLCANLDGLRSLDLFWWLALEHVAEGNASHTEGAHRDRTALVVNKLVELSKVEPSEILVGALDASRRLDRDAWADLADRIAHDAPPYLRHALYASARGGAVFDACASLDRQLSASRREVLTPSLSEMLFANRRDDRRCLAELHRLAADAPPRDRRGEHDVRTLATDAALAIAHLAANAPSSTRDEPSRAIDVGTHANASTTIETVDFSDFLDDGEMFGALDVEPAVSEINPESARMAMLDSLSRDRVPARQQLGAAVESLRSLAPSRHVVLWLAPRLATRTAWENAGPALFDGFIDHGAWAELCELLAMVEAPATAIGATFAKALIRRADRALDTRDEATSIASLSALICLDPPSLVSRSLHALRKRAAPESDTAALADTALRLFRHGKGREADVEGLIATVHALASLTPTTPH